MVEGSTLLRCRTGNRTVSSNLTVSAIFLCPTNSLYLNILSDNSGMNMTTELLFTIFDLAGTFVFALSGALAARERKLDIFGLITVAFLTACGGGIIRDVCIGYTPPVGISEWPYLALTICASFVSIGFHKLIQHLKYPVLLFDAIGLSMFAVAGAQKSIFMGHNYEVAILLGVLSAIGGGIIRDLLLGKIPVVLRKEVYGSAALLGTFAVVISHYLNIGSQLGAWFGITLCFITRYISIKRKWNLPSFSEENK